MENKDIFDRIMSLKIFHFAFPFYKKYKEQLLYLFFGALTTAINIAVFYIFTETIKLNELIANIISWLLAVFFAFATNKIWVFKGASGGFLKQMLSFYMGRVATLLIEELILYVFITRLALYALAVKTAAQIIVILLNYIISKMFVFKR